MRLFVAIDVPGDIRKRLHEFMKQLNFPESRIKLVGPENLHFTVKFLGEVGEDKLHDIENRINLVVKGFLPFDISVEKTGFFGKPDHIKTVWTDVVTGHETITDLMREMNSSLKHFMWESREPVPHLTLGRVKDSSDTSRLHEKLRETIGMKFGEFRVSDVKLKSSRLTPEGSIYSDVKAFSLGE